MIVCFLLLTSVASAQFSYWIEGGNETVWVNVSSIPVGESEIQIVKLAGYAPSGADTFDFYDNFSVDSESDYTVVETSSRDSFTYDAINDRMNFVAGGRDGQGQWMAQATSLDTMAIHGTVQFTTTPADAYDNKFGVGLVETLANSPEGYHLVLNKGYNSYTSDGARTNWMDNTSTTGNSDNPYTPDYSVLKDHVFKFELKYNGTDFLASTEVDGTNTYTLNTTINVTDIGYFVLGDMYPDALYSPHASTSPGYIDNVFLRKYVAEEPTVEITDEGSFYNVVITNDGDALENYTIALDGPSLDIVAYNDSLKIDAANTPTYDISGTVTDDEDTALENVTVTMLRRTLQSVQATETTNSTGGWNSTFTTDNVSALFLGYAIDLENSSRNSDIIANLTYNTTGADFVLENDYTAPSNTNVSLVLDDTASSTTTCEITTDTTITSDLDCSGETFSVTNAATATVSAGITVQALKTNVNNGKINLKAGAKLQQGVS